MFESPYIKIDEHGVNLIKNYQVKRHIDYLQISSVILKKGHLINNWILSLTLALTLTAITLIWGLKYTMTFDLHNIPSAHFRSYIAFRLIAPWLLFIGGSIWVYLSMKRSTIIVIYSNQKKYKIALKEFAEEGTLDDLINFLSDRVELIKQ